MDIWKIYVTTNLINGKKYVGRTKHDNSKYFGSGKLIKQAVEKYGMENFTKEYIDEAIGYSDASIKEVDYILKINTLIPYGYNLVPHGEGGFITERQKKQISKTVSKLWKDPNSVYNTDEYRVKLSESHKGREVSETTRKKIGNANLGARNGRAAQVEIDGILYSTRREAAKKYGISDTMVGKRCNNDKFPNWNYKRKK